MAYTAPTLAELRASVLRDLRDPNAEVFSNTEVDDYIRGGIADLNTVAPIEGSETIPFAVAQTAYTTVLKEPFRVEVWREGKPWAQVPYNTDNLMQQGWEWMAGDITLPHAYLNYLVLGDLLICYGYTSRDYPELDTDVLEVDPDGEFAIRRYAQAQGYGSLSSDRALFQQWQAQPNNSDVTPAGLEGMRSRAEGMWNSERNHLRILRRAPN